MGASAIVTHSPSNSPDARRGRPLPRPAIRRGVRPRSSSLMRHTRLTGAAARAARASSRSRVSSWGPCRGDAHPPPADHLGAVDHPFHSTGVTIVNVVGVVSVTKPSDSRRCSAEEPFAHPQIGQHVSTMRTSHSSSISPLEWPYPEQGLSTGVLHDLRDRTALRGREGYRLCQVPSTASRGQLDALHPPRRVCRLRRMRPVCPVEAIFYGTTPPRSGLSITTSTSTSAKSVRRAVPTGMARSTVTCYRRPPAPERVTSSLGARLPDFPWTRWWTPGPPRRTPTGCVTCRSELRRLSPRQPPQRCRRLPDVGGLQVGTPALRSAIGGLEGGGLPYADGQVTYFPWSAPRSRPRRRFSWAWAPVMWSSSHHRVPDLRGRTDRRCDGRCYRRPRRAVASSASHLINSPANPRRDPGASVVDGWTPPARSGGLATSATGNSAGTQSRVSAHPEVNGGSLQGVIAAHSLSKRSNLAGFRAGFTAGGRH